jgi:transposase
VDDETNDEEPWREDRQSIKRATRKHYSSKEKIRIVLDGLRGGDSIAELCRREGISLGIYHKWSKDVMEAGKRRLAGDTARAANTEKVKANGETHYLWRAVDHEGDCAIWPLE